MGVEFNIHSWFAPNVVMSLSGREMTKKSKPYLLVDPIEFDDLDMDLIYTMVKVFSSILKIKGTVCVVDRDQWISIFEKSKTRKKKAIYEELDYVYGQCYPHAKVIYINPRLCKREWSVLISTILHELLHIKFPKKSEVWISELEGKMMGRFDSHDRCGRV